MNPRTFIAGCLRSLSRRAIGHPRLTLALAALVTLVAAPGMLHLKLRTDGRALVSPTAPEVEYDRQIRGEFGIQDQIVVLVRSTGTNGIFNSGTLQLVRDLTGEFQKLPGLNPSNVISLATEPGFRMRPGSVTPARLLERPLDTPAELNGLRDDLRRIELYTGTLVSFDGRMAAIVIGLPPEGDRAQLIRRVQDRLAGWPPSPDEIALTGSPVAESLLGVHVLEDLGVPRAWLGGAESRATRGAWRVPKNLHDARLLLAQRTGLAPLTIVAMMLIFFLTFRNPFAMLAPLPGVLATLFFVFGLMGWAGVPLYLTTAVLPVLLVATGVTNDIYLFTRYFGQLRENPATPPRDLLAGTFEQLAGAVAMTSIATGIGFFSFALSPLEPVRAFGVWAGIGTLSGLLCSLTVVPALLAVIPPAWVAPRGAGQRPPVSRLAAIFSRVGRAVASRRVAVIAFIILLAALTPPGLRRLAVQDSWSGAFEPDSDFRRATRLVNDNFLGVDLLLVCLDATHLKTGDLPAPPDEASRIVLPGDLCRELPEIEGAQITLSAEPTNGGRPRLWRSQLELPRRTGANIVAWIVPAPGSADFARDPGGVKVRYELSVRAQLKPEIVAANRALAEFLRQRTSPGVGGVIGPYEYLATTRFMMRPDDPAARDLMPLAAENRTLWDYYAYALGQDRFHQIMDTNYSRSLTTIFLKDANFADTARLMGDIRAYEREQLAPLGIKLGFAGDVAVSQSLIQGIVATQVRSLCWSLLGIFAVTAVLGGSWRWGVFCVLPSLLAVVVKFAVMGWLGIPLGVATSMFAAMTLGIGVNCAIHLLAGFDQARATGQSPPDALAQALWRSGPPAFVNTAAISLGFGLLMLSQVPANARLGLLLVLGLVNCFGFSLVLLPVLLTGRK